MKKIISLVLFAVMIILFSACGNGDSVFKNDEIKNAQSSETNNKPTGGFASKEYSDKNELYAFVKSYLDYKKPSYETLNDKKSEFKDTVAELVEGDWAIDIPIMPLGEIRNLEKSGNSWSGAISTYNYEITKSGDIYSFKFIHTAMEQVTEGSCDIKTGVLQLTVRSPYTTQKYQVKALGNGAYLRFWSEKSDILEKTRAHYTYFKGNDIAVGQEETISPKELTGTDFFDDKYVENNEAWIKFIGGKTSFFDGVNN